MLAQRRSKSMSYISYILSSINYISYIPNFYKLYLYITCTFNNI